MEITLVTTRARINLSFHNRIIVLKNGRIEPILAGGLKYNVVCLVGSLSTTRRLQTLLRRNIRRGMYLSNDYWETKERKNLSIK